MTLKALAEGLNVSVMTVYRRCKANNINMQDLRGDDGELTSEGVSVLASLFDNTTPGNTSTTSDATTSTTPASHGNATEDNSVEVARLTAEVEGLRRLVDVLEAQVSDLRSRLDAAEAERRQRDQLLLTGGGFRGWWRRFRGGDRG